MVTPLPRLPTLHCYSQRVIIEPRRLKAQHRFFFFCLSSSFLLMIVIICSFLWAVAYLQVYSIVVGAVLLERAKC
jgi:uncharacterized protein YqhQ